MLEVGGNLCKASLLVGHVGSSIELLDRAVGVVVHCEALGQVSGFHALFHSPFNHLLQMHSGQIGCHLFLILIVGCLRNELPVDAGVRIGSQVDARADGCSGIGLGAHAEPHLSVERVVVRILVCSLDAEILVALRHDLPEVVGLIVVVNISLCFAVDEQQLPTVLGQGEVIDEHGLLVPHVIDGVLRDGHLQARVTDTCLCSPGITLSEEGTGTHVVEIVGNGVALKVSSKSGVLILVHCCR